MRLRRLRRMRLRQRAWSVAPIFATEGVRYDITAHTRFDRTQHSLSDTWLVVHNMVFAPGKKGEIVLSETMPSALELGQFEDTRAARLAYRCRPRALWATPDTLTWFLSNFHRRRERVINLR